MIDTSLNRQDEILNLLSYGSSNLIENADKFTTNNRQFANALTGEAKNPVVKLFQIAEFQNQALQKLMQAIELIP